MTFCLNNKDLNSTTSNINTDNTRAIIIIICTIVARSCKMSWKSPSFQSSAFSQTSILAINLFPPAITTLRDSFVVQYTLKLARGS